MPDHIHFFCTPATECDLSRFVGGFRQESTRRAWEAGWQGKLWQREFFDRLLRGDESYERKWLYVRDNPVRAGLCQRPDEWRWQGELGVL
jgi:putative transposase